MTQRNLYLCEVAPPKGRKCGFPFENGDIVLMLGEIGNMPGYCAVVLRDGEVAFPYETVLFRRLSRKELGA